MGDHLQVLVDLDATSADASVLADRALDWLVREGIVVAERNGDELWQANRLGHFIFDAVIAYPPESSFVAPRRISSITASSARPVVRRR